MYPTLPRVLIQVQLRTILSLTNGLSVLFLRDVKTIYEFLFVFYFATAQNIIFTFTKFVSFDEIISSTFDIFHTNIINKQSINPWCKSAKNVSIKLS